MEKMKKKGFQVFMHRMYFLKSIEYISETQVRSCFCFENGKNIN